MKVAVVGGGISGVSVAYLLKRHTKYDILLIEKDRIGGKAYSEKRGGYLIETGPNGFLSNKAEIKKLIAESGFDSEIIESKDESNRKFIFSNGKLWEIPRNPAKMLLSGFLSPQAKLKLLKEPFVKPVFDDETVESFVKRRLGHEFLDKIIGPMVCGVFAGDPKIMSMESNFPKIKEIEREYGSLIKGLISMMREKKAKADSISGGFSSKLLSFKNGVGSFVEHLSKDVETVKDEVLSVESVGGRYRLLGKTNSYVADIVVFSLPSYSLKRVVKNFDSEFADYLNEIPYAPMAVLALGFESSKLPEVKNSFGYLFDLNEIEDTIGVLFDSSIFEHRAKQEKTLIRIMIGGQLAKESPFKSNLVAMGMKELNRSANIHYPFEFAYKKVHHKAIPVYTLGHKRVKEAVLDFEKKHKGIFITGNAFFGVSLNDCVKAAYNTLEKMKSGL